MNAFDPSGLDYFFLNDSGAVFGQGHAASLVGNPTTGYDYYSKDGYPPNRNQVAHFDTLDQFRKDPLSSRYNRGLEVATTPDQDAAMRLYADHNFNRRYDFRTTNCGDLAAGIMNAGGINVPNQKMFGITRPKTQFDNLLLLPRPGVIAFIPHQR